MTESTLFEFLDPNDDGLILHLNEEEIDSAFHDAVETADEDVEAEHNKEEVIQREVVGAVHKECI